MSYAIAAIALAIAAVCAAMLFRARARANRLGRAIESAPSNLMITDRNGEVVFSSNAARELLADMHAALHDRLVAPGTPFALHITVAGMPVKLAANPYFDGAGNCMGTIVRWADREAEIQLAREEIEHAEATRAAAMQSERIRQALDAATASVMVTDDTGAIIYLNRTAQQLMLSMQAEFRRTLPHFDAMGLVGANIDVFTRGQDQHVALSSHDEAWSSEMKFGMCILRVSASPIIDPSGKRLGTVVEWGDRTQEIAVQTEVQNVVADMLKGNLERRISLAGKQGFLRDLSTGINGLVDNVAAVVSEVQALVKAVNGGNLEQRIHTEGKSGLMVKLGSGINELTANVAEVVEQVQGLVTSANEGDLNCRIQTEGRSGLLVKMASGINQLTADMAGMVSQVKAAAGEVHRGAEEITVGNITLSQRMEEQASSLEETASSMEEMTSTVKQNADNAGQANQLAMAARDQAEKGGAVVSRAVQAMAEINNASRRIADIISVIDEIAFQTNLLALNAAVEAARAGEQGRGFAVVATEVRNLAGRSATAAKEIKALIQDSVQKVQDGSMLVTQSGVTLEQIVASVKKVTDIVAEIAAASGEQSAGIEQVNKAVMQLDDLTQQNAALVEQASAASQSMTGQARSLNELMRHYNVAATGKPVAPRPAAHGAESSDAMERSAATGTDGAVWREF